MTGHGSRARKGRLQASLVLAALLHLAILFWLSRLPAPPVSRPRSVRPQQLAIELWAPPPPAPTTTNGEPASTASAVGHGSRPRAARAPRRARAATRAAPAATAAPTVGTAPVAAARPPPRHPIDLGLGGDIYWMLRNQTAPRTALPRKPLAVDHYHSAGGLTAGLDAHDRALGLGRGGPVAVEARRVAITRGPEVGRATLVVQTDASGEVQSITLGAVWPSVPDWQRVIAALHAALRAKHLRVPPGARGLRITVRVEARQQLPSGSSPGNGVDFKGAGVGFDLADLSGRVMRVVSARVVGEQVL